MKGPRIKPLSEMIAELDEEVRQSEEWRKAQGIPKSAYDIKKVFNRVFAVIDGRGARDEVDE